ncbi:MAG: hypothetical protein TE42_00495 [Candidatus Synechococcus spongiarum SP3]|uniref:Transposase DDE domain-containing protein n=1 Tax=Candidatus Synechococcus spongiarum SP3 TaxID=1604020 RepID=A0A0G2HND1_9SYNE|nr:MAG: hypothetical protein TE42_00495 [Candidatus Synechococcus spongiarum SP3]
MGLEYTRHGSLIHTLVHILSCLAAYTLTQLKVNIGKTLVLNSMAGIPTASWPYPVFGNLTLTSTAKTRKQQQQAAADLPSPQKASQNITKPAKELELCSPYPGLEFW